ncbi:MAG: transposase [Candidatus Gastranaerophilaceae bacterium]|jgi:transposase
MTKTLYAGIDVSKDKLDIAITQNGKQIISTAIFENKASGHKKIFVWAKKFLKGFSEIHFCIEATNIYHEEIAEYLQEQSKTIVSTLISERAREKTRLHSCKDNDVANVLKGTIKFYSQSIAQIEQKIKEHVNKFAKLNAHVKLLKSIKGISDQTAW